MSDVFASMLDLNVFELATLADCRYPDDADSTGGRYLRAVRDALVESVRASHDEDPSLSWANLADHLRDVGADDEWIADSISIYTHEMWTTFVDLCAWEQDVSDYGRAEDATDVCRWSLYVIGQQLVGALLVQVDDFPEDDADETDDDEV